MELKEKRKKVEDLILNTMKMDSTNYNYNKYKEFFESMNDSEFKKWADDFFEDEEKNLYLEITPFQHNDLSITNIKKVADYLKIPLDEYVYMPFLNPDGKPVRTREKTAVGHIHVKRLEQILSKKNAYSSDISQRNAKTNQVTSDDKNGRVSDSENYALLVLGAENALKEFMSARSDDMVMKQTMLKDISREGYTSLKNMHSDISNKTALNTLDVYYTGAGILTDLITPGMATLKTLNNKETKESLSSKYE